MLRKSLLAAAVLSLWASTNTVRSETDARLDPATMAVALNTAHPDELAYITYTVALVDLQVLSRDLVDSAFQWARRKPFRRKKFQYFKHAVTQLAARAKVTLPTDTPDLTPTIQGQVVTRVLLVDVPVAGATVKVRGTNLQTTSDLLGNFTFANVPYGTYTIDATSGLVPLTGSATVSLPNPVPPAVDPAQVTVRVK